MWSHTACGIETIWILALEPAGLQSHVISYRLRYWNVFLGLLNPLEHLGSHVISYRLRYWNWRLDSCKIYYGRVTCDLIPLAVLKLLRQWSELPSQRCHMWSHTACGIETQIDEMHITVAVHVTCDLIPLAVLKPERLWVSLQWRRVTCDLIPLAVLKPMKIFHQWKSDMRHMWSHTACGIETPQERYPQEM